MAKKGQKVQSLFKQGDGFITSRGDKLADVYLPPPPARKGTPAWKLWAMECFATLVGAGFNYSQACERLGVNYRWWRELALLDPDWAAEIRELRENGTDHNKKQWRDMSGVSFTQFILDYSDYGYIADHHYWIAEALEDPMGKLVLVLGHPESAKSTVISLWYVLYTLAKDPDARIALVSKSLTKAQDMLTRVKRYMTEPHLYIDSPRNFIEDFGGWKPDYGTGEWSMDQIFIKHRTSGERDPSVQALGIGKQIYGARLDLLILDDALVLDNQISETNRERIDMWFTNEARSRAQRGQTVVAGTRLAPFDLYGQWKKSWSGLRTFRGVYIPALQEEWTENERPTWHQYWQLDGHDVVQEINGEIVVTGHQPGLRDIRAEIMARDPSRWRLVYQQEDVEESEAIFRQDHIDRAFELGEGRRMGTVYDHEILILGIDPATTGRAASVLIAVDPETRVRTVVDLFVGERLGASGIRQDLMYRFWDRYRDHRIDFTVIETNFAPTLMGDEAFLDRAEAYGTRLVKHTTVGRGTKRGSKWDEEYGIAALASLFSGGLIAFANASPEEKEKYRPLTEDMIMFPWASTQDALVALWVANGEANSTSRAVKSMSYEAVALRRGTPPSVINRSRSFRT
jgi:hypothetical protein